MSASEQAATRQAFLESGPARLISLAEAADLLPAAYSEALILAESPVVKTRSLRLAVIAASFQVPVSALATNLVFVFVFVLILFCRCAIPYEYISDTCNIAEKRAWGKVRGNALMLTWMMDCEACGAAFWTFAAARAGLYPDSLTLRRRTNYLVPTW